MLRLVTLLLALAVAGAGIGGPALAQDKGDDTPDVPRELTMSELRREIAILQREFEELIVRIGDGEATDAQRKRMHELSVRLIDLQDQRDRKQAEVEEKMDTGQGFSARWMRLRKAAEDITTWDVKDGMFRIHLGVRFQLDATGGWEDRSLEETVGALTPSLKFRRFRIFADGRLFRTIDFKFEYDFAADLGLKDAFLEGSKYLKVMKWRVGQFKEPFSLARQNSANYLGFLEWPLPVQALAPGRSIGIMLRHNEAIERMTWAASMTTSGRTTDDNRSAANITLTGRVTGLPLYDKERHRLIHLGVAYSSRKPSSGTEQYFARPEARFAPTYMDTGDIDSDQTHLLGFEAAAVRGPLWLQGEFIASRTESDELGNLEFGGWYVQAGYFLTGEHRLYETPEATFGRLIPNRLFRGGNPFTGKGDGGAIEVTGRLSSLDLNSGATSAGDMRDITVGMNWYVSHTTRVMFNYVRSTLVNVGTGNIFLLRFQFNP